MRRMIIPLVMETVKQSIARLMARSHISKVVIGLNGNLYIKLYVTPKLVELFFPKPGIYQGSVCSAFFMFMRIR